MEEGKAGETPSGMSHMPDFPPQPLAVLYINRPLRDADVEYLDFMLAMIGCEWRKGEGRTARVKAIEERGGR